MFLGGENMTYEEARVLSKCQESADATEKLYHRENPGIVINWLAVCPDAGPVTKLVLTNAQDPDSSARVQIKIDERLITRVLALKALQELSMWVDSGQAPQEFGALSHLQRLEMLHTCLTGMCRDMLVEHNVSFCADPGLNV
jgi:hypothetical protein